MPDYLRNPSPGAAKQSKETEMQTQTVNPYANFNPIEQAGNLGITVDPALRGFLPSGDVLEKAYERMLTSKDSYKQSFGLGVSNMRNQYGNQISQMTGGQGLMSMMGSGFGSKSRGIVKNIGDVRSAYSGDIAGGLLNFQNQMRSADYKFEDAKKDYDDSLIDRLIQLERLYGEDKPDYIQFT
jgi:hypothetical protein